MRPFAPPRRERDMTYHRTQQNLRDHQCQPPRPAQGRRGTGGLVLAAQFPAVRARHRPMPTGADKMPNGVVSDPHVFVSIDAGRHRHHRGGTRRDGHRRRAHHPADDRRRRARCRLGEGAHRAIAGRRGDLRQPGYRRLAQRAPLHPADAACAAPRHADAGAGRRQALGRRGRRGRRRSIHEVDAHAVRAQARLWRTRGRCRGVAGARARQVQLKEPSAFRYIGKGNVTHRRPVRHHDRQRDLRPGREAPRHEVRRHCAAAGGRRQGRVVRRGRDHEGAGRREGGEDRRHAARPRSSLRSAASR